MANRLVPFGDDFRPVIPEILSREVSDYRDPLTVRGNALSQLLYQRMLRSVSLGDFIRDGVLNTALSPFAITKAGAANLSWTVDPGKAVAQPYLMSTPATTVTAQPVTTARWDLVVIRSSDSPISSYAPSVDTIEIIRGVSGTSYPATPARCIALWGLKFAANATNTATVEDLRRYTAPPGGIVRVAKEADGAGLPPGTQIFDTSTNLLKIANATGAGFVSSATDWAYFNGVCQAPSGNVTSTSAFGSFNIGSGTMSIGVGKDIQVIGDNLQLNKPGMYAIQIDTFMPSGAYENFRRFTGWTQSPDAAWTARFAGQDNEDNWSGVGYTKVDRGQSQIIFPHVYQSSSGTRQFNTTIKVMRTDVAIAL